MQSKLALEGIKVIDLTQAYAAPLAAGLLAQWGAEVIHVEHPVQGDQTRVLRRSNTYGIFEQANINKKGLTADLVQKEGREIIYRLAAKSDVFLSNLRPYEIERFEMHYETLRAINPRIIYANLTGYGIKGPEKDAGAVDADSYFARSGIMHTSSDSEGVPIRSRGVLGDSPSAAICALGIVVALFARERLGIGQAVYTSLYNCGVWASASDTLQALATHQDPERQWRESASNPLSNFYRTKDNRWILLAPSHVRPRAEPDPSWRSFCQTIEREELVNDPRFESRLKRSENNVALINIISEAFAKKTFKEWEERLAKFGVRFAPLQKPTEVVSDPQARANDFFQTFNDPVYGAIELLAAPVKLSETPDTLRTPTPQLGQHTEGILLELGYSREELSRLRDKKVI